MKVLVSRVLVGATLALLSIGAWATDDGHTIEQFEQFKVELHVTANDAENHGFKVSGTKVEVASTPMAFSKAAGADALYDGIGLKTAEIKINGDPVAFNDGSAPGGLARSGDPGGELDDLRPPPEEWIGVPIEARPVPVRFSSNHFEDDSEITILYETIWGLYKNGVQTGSRTITATLKVKAFNRLLAWKTTRDDVGATPFAYQSIVDAVMQEAHTGFAAAKYSTIPLTLGDDLLNWKQMSDHSGSATAWAVNSHGNSTGVQDSGVATGSSSTSSSGQFQLWSTWATTAHPLKLAIVAAYACATMTTNNVIATRVPLRIEPNNWVDGAYIGSFTVIYSAPNDASGQPTDYTLDQHAKKFFESLAAGKTVQGALSVANADASLNLGPGVFEMVVRGDPLTTLTDVYLTAAERATLGLSLEDASGRWYFSGAL